MTQKTWILTDTESDQYVDAISIGPDEAQGTARDYRVSKRRLRGGVRDGVDVVEIDNGCLAFTVLPTRGMGIWRARAGGLDVGWNSPIRGPVHPRWVPLMEPSGLGWLDGFDELLVRCGLESNGAPDFGSDGRLTFPLHGKIANRPAHHVSVSIDGDRGDIEILGVVEETRFHFAKLRLTTRIQTRVGEPGMRIHDQVENLSGVPADTQLLYHINFGPPLLEPGSMLVAPVQTVVPRNARAAEGISDWTRYGAAQPGSEEQVYFCHLWAGPDERTEVLLKNAAGDRGVGIDMNVGQLPCFTLWKNTVADQDGYVTGLEPGTNFPNPRGYESQQGRIVTLPAGGVRSYEVGLTIHRSRDDVAKAEGAIGALQGAGAPQVFETPQPGWCAS